MQDEAGPDAKIIAVLEGDPDYEHVRGLEGLPPHLLEEIEHFFNIYKDLEPGKSSSTAGFEGVEAALREIADARARAG
jgi:inorganic pyrophosphatase